MTEELTRFEDAYWSISEQSEVFRHRQALSWIAGDIGDVLDVGCGDGFFLRLLQEKGIAARGVDISSVAVEKCTARGLDASVFDFANGALPDVKVRYAALLDVLEHLYDPVPVLAALRARADELIISVPNFSSLPARLQVLFGRVPENNTPRKGHIYWYTQGVLERRLSETGWTIVAQGVNPPWMRRPFVGPFMILLARWRPSLFSLSFVVKARRTDACV